MSFHTKTTSLKLGRYTIEGLSIAGVHTAISVKELNMCFDIGLITNQSINCDKVLISHGHNDHIQGYFKHFRCRKLKGMTKPVYVVPSILYDEIINCSTAQFNMEKGIVEYDLPDDFIDIEVFDPGDEYNFFIPNTADSYVKSYRMMHKIPSRGYSVIREISKLKREYWNLDPYEIKELRNKNVNLFYTNTVIDIAYTGDTTIEGVLQHDDFLNSDILLLECTILDSSLTPEETAYRGHIHIQHIADNWKLFNNKHIILFHMSARYCGIDIRKLVSSGLKGTPRAFRKKIKLLWPKNKKRDHKNKR